MADVTDLIGAAYDALFKSVNLGSSAFLQLAWPGIALSPVDFKDPATPAGPYDPGYAEETFSFLSNIVPAFDTAHFINSGFEVDDLYQLAICGAVPVGVAPDQLLTNPLYKLFSDAQFDFLSARRGSRKDPSVFYYPCQALPTDWYTEANAATWLTFSSSSTKSPPPPLGLSQFGKSGGAGLLAKGLWQLKPTTDEQTVKTKLQQAIQTKATKFATLNKAVTNKAIFRPLNQPLLATAGPTGAASPAAAATTPALLTAAAKQNFIRLNASIDFKKQLRPDPLLSANQLPPALVNQTQIDLAHFEVIDTRQLPFNKKFILNGLLNEQLVPQAVSGASTNFSISFRYAQVTISRPWLKLALLSTHNWYIPGTPAEAYATGSTTANTGMFAMLPTSFIAIRDLKISANWSAQDRANATRAAAFGPFSTKASSFNQDTLTIPGLQIIAWVSRLMPALPPLKDPTLP